MKLEVTEIFRSIEGETKTAGFPAVFVRLTGCNLNCRYCDSRYALAKGAQMNITEIRLAVEKLSPVHHVTLTGGEPLLQKGAAKLIDSLCDWGYNIQIETNGSLPLKGLNKAARLIVDVKTPSSGAGGSFLMENLDCLRTDDELKFVVCSESDYLFACEFIASHKPEATVNLSPAAPLGRKKLSEWMLRDKVNARLNLQLHKIIGMR
ncbi:MAG: radical SAM protein [Leptospirales bacterium]|nr:radical SAM protein [Leptospirales bacterium]